MDILRDPVWQFIAVIIALIAIIVTLTQRYRKEIVYDIISDTPILSIKEEVKNRVKVLFDDKPMTNARLIILRIWNSGNVPIIPSDYIEPITLNFGADAEILDADILASIPDDIKSKLTL